MSNFVSLDTIYAASLNELRSIVGNRDSEFFHPEQMQSMRQSDSLKLVGEQMLLIKYRNTLIDEYLNMEVYYLINVQQSY